MTPELASQLALKYIAKFIPNSSTRLSLNPNGYPETGVVHVTIKGYRDKGLSPSESAREAVKTGCGNCQEMAYAGAAYLVKAGYKGYIAIGQYGINHQFLIVGDRLVDGWSGKNYRRHDWQKHIAAFGGSVKNSVLRGRLLSPTHEELEDEVPEVVEVIQYPIKKAKPAKNSIHIFSNKIDDANKFKCEPRAELPHYKLT